VSPEVPTTLVIPCPALSSTGADTWSYTSLSWTDEKELKIFRNLCEFIPAWNKFAATPDDLVFKRLNGNSNACFKVSLKDSIQTDD
jgi:hypothetical protein